jgi:hypothetical protein
MPSVGKRGVAKGHKKAREKMINFRERGCIEPTETVGHLVRKVEEAPRPSPTRTPERWCVRGGSGIPPYRGNSLCSLTHPNSRFLEGKKR